MSNRKLIPDETPNVETLEAIKEIENAGGTITTDDTQSFFRVLLED